MCCGGDGGVVGCWTEAVEAMPNACLFPIQMQYSFLSHILSLVFAEGRWHRYAVGASGSLRVEGTSPNQFLSVK